MTNKKILVVYGSLKKDKYNHYLIEKEEYLGKMTLFGIMQSAGEYPYFFEPIVAEERKNAKIKSSRRHEAEIYEVSEEVYQSIKEMELSSGYYEKEIRTEYGQGIVFMTQPELYSEKKKKIKKY